jgi:hypothetical protein
MLPQKEQDQRPMIGVLFCVMPFMLPLIIGLALVRRTTTSGLSHLSGWLTLKPLVATPLWIALVAATSTGNWSRPSLAYGLTALPGVGLTIVLVWVFRAEVRWRPINPVWLLLVLDTLRWGSSFLLGFDTAAAIYLVLMSLAMPTVFALCAWRVCAVPKPILQDKAQRSGP